MNSLMWLDPLGSSGNNLVDAASGADPQRDGNVQRTHQVTHRVTLFMTCT